MNDTADSFEAKLDRAHQHLQSTKIWRWNYNPPLYRSLRAAGIKIPPPHLTGFVFNAVFSALWFGLFWGIAMWFLAWSDQNMPVAGAVTGALTTGGIFGVFMGLYYTLSRRSHGLPSWNEV